MNEIEGIWQGLAERYPVLEGCREDIMEAYHEMRESFARGGKLLICGNGGSSADAQHIVGELMKEFGLHRAVPEEFAAACRRLYPGQGLEEKLQGALPAIAIGVNPAFASAYANDVAPEMAYAQAAGLRCIGLGGLGGMLRELCDVYVALPESETYLVQELTLPVYHAWCRMLEWAFWGGKA